MRFVRSIFLLLLVFTVVVPAPIYADPPSKDEIKALNEYPNWVADNCGATGAVDTSLNDVKPRIVLDPGHSGQDISDTDPQTGLYDHDYPNIPEISEVYTVAQKVRNKLNADGYSVVMTKDSVDDSVSFRQRAEIANSARADLAVSIHDNHDTSWGNMGTSSGSGGEVYVQKNGLYRQNQPGMGQGQQKVVFDNSDVAQKSQQYGRIFAQQRTKDEGHKVSVEEVNFNGRASLPNGNIPMVQLFSKVPWVYNEVGAPSGPLSDAEINKYAQGIVDSIENSIPSDGLQNNQASQVSSCTCQSNGSGSTVALQGNSNQEKIFNYFLQKGLTPNQAAGITGNFGQESGYNPSSPGGYLAQWGGSRLTALEAFAQKNSKPVTDLGLQLDYVWADLTNAPGAGGDYRNVLRQVKATTTVEDATLQFMGTASVGGNVYGYENPGTPALANRIAYAKDTLQKFGGGAGAVSAAGSPCSPSISPDCASATGSAVILCEAKKYDPVDYVWGGGHAGGGPYHNACPTIKSNDTACGLDCSGLVSVAVYDAFKGDPKLAWDTNSLRADTQNWKEISFKDLQPGDVIEPETTHVEIIDHVSGNSITTFGAHTSSYAQPDQVGPGHYTDTPGYRYYHYVGEGAQ